MMNQGKADIHIHTDFSDGLHEPEAIINYAVTQTDLQVIAITDHNTIDGARIAYDYWQAHREEFGHLEVIKGIEISSTEGHIIGLYLEEDIPAHMSPADTVKAIHEQGGLAIAAHPFTHLLTMIGLQGIGKAIGELPLDGVEIQNSTPVEFYTNWMTASYNRKHRNHAELGGSDTHIMTMMGKSYTNFPGRTAAEFRGALKAGEVSPGGRLNGPKLAFDVVEHLVRSRQLPIFLPNDRNYRHAGAALTVQVEELRHAPAAIVHCIGRITRGEDADMLQNECYRLLDGQIDKIIIDLKGVTFIDSAGLGAVVAAQKRAKKLDGTVVLCQPSRGVALSLKMVRLDKIFKIYGGQDQAIAALSN